MMPSLALALNDRSPAATGAAIQHQNLQNQSQATPSDRQRLEGSSMVRDRRSVDGKFPAADGRGSPAYTMTQAQWRMRSRGSMEDFHRRVAPGHPFPSKVIAQVVECSPKTAQSWLAGETTPAGILDLRCMSAIPEYAALKREIAALQMDLDPRVQVKLMELHKMMLHLSDDPRAAAAVKRGQP